MEKIAGVILAAGKGTRMNNGSGSDIPKVMYQANGKPLVEYCVNNLRNSGIQNIVLVVGYKKEMVKDYFGDEVLYSVQEEQLGTGHAAMMAEGNLKGKSDAVLVCYGDMPLFKTETIKRLIEKFEEEKPTIAMLSVNFEDPEYWVYGRIIRDSNGEVDAIVEQKDCNEIQMKVKESNPGFYIFDADWLWDNFSKLKSNNAQKEYYLTDLIHIAKEQGRRVIAIPVSEEAEALGVNTPEQLAQAEKILK